MNPQTDEQEKQLLSLLRTGDESALRRIFDQHYPALLKEAYRILPDEDTCKDIVQEVFVELWRKRADLTINGPLRAYLRRAAFNRALNFAKSQKRYQFGAAEEAVESSGWEVQVDTEETHTAQQSVEDDLHAAIQGLPEKCRLVFNLSRFEDLSHKEIAEQLGISTKTIENQITKALKILRATMYQYRDLSPIVISILCGWRIL